MNLWSASHLRVIYKAKSAIRSGDGQDSSHVAIIVPAAETVVTVPASGNLGFQNLASESTLRRCIYARETSENGSSILIFTGNEL